jgi:hypothetical protein
MTSTQISVLLCNITHNLNFADAQLLVKFLMRGILNNTIVAMLRHDNDVEADSKTKYKAVRAQNPRKQFRL